MERGHKTLKSGQWTKKERTLAIKDTLDVQVCKAGELGRNPSFLSIDHDMGDILQYDDDESIDLIK